MLLVVPDSSTLWDVRELLHGASAFQWGDAR
jgi:hypothetical protein